MTETRLILGDCLTELPKLASASVDAVITDPPYPCIDRPYGYWTEAEWFAMMRVVVPECMRIVKPTGSAVFILQPNSERVGRMRTWLWEFMLWVGREWGIVQDAWWWNYTALPMTKNDNSFLRGSIKACVWVGQCSCFRNVASVRWEESDANKFSRMAGRCTNRLQNRPSGATVRDTRAREAAERNGGVTPFNLLPMKGRSAFTDSANEHGAATPEELCQWWSRYICPDGGTILDPFIGSGTVGLAAIKQGLGIVGIERDPGYHAIATKRIAAERAKGNLFA